jgi:hypothetical protein
MRLKQLGDAEEHLRHFVRRQVVALRHDVQKFRDQLAALPRVLSDHFRIIENTALLQHGRLLKILER